MRIDTTSLRRIGDVIRDMLGDDFDAVTYWDTLDGETDALDVIDRVLSDRAEALALADAAQAQAKQLEARAKRLTARAAAMDRALLSILDAAGERRVERPAATVSRRAGRMSVAITELHDIPTQLTRVRVEPDKTLIRKALEAGETIPGAELVRGEDGVTVRVA